jgi:hypothetical protein
MAAFTEKAGRITPAEREICGKDERHFLGGYQIPAPRL